MWCHGCGSQVQLVLTVAGPQVWGLNLLHTGTVCPHLFNPAPHIFPSPGTVCTAKEPGGVLLLAGGFECQWSPWGHLDMVGSWQVPSPFLELSEDRNLCPGPAHPIRPKEMGSGSSGRMSPTVGMQLQTLGEGAIGGGR